MNTFAMTHWSWSILITLYLFPCNEFLDPNSSNEKENSYPFKNLYENRSILVFMLDMFIKLLWFNRKWILTKISPKRTCESMTSSFPCFMWSFNILFAHLLQILDTEIQALPLLTNEKLLVLRQVPRCFFNIL